MIDQHEQGGTSPLPVRPAQRAPALFSARRRRARSGLLPDAVHGTERLVPSPQSSPARGESASAEGSASLLRLVPAGEMAGSMPRPVESERAASATDPSGAWLLVATAGLAALSAAAATVSYTAQYRMVLAARHQEIAAGLEAAIPDAGALVFASLGIALALHGRRAVRARALNVVSVAASVAMNVLAASPGWRPLAIWAMPPVAYALASDTMIAVVRARAVARQRALASRLADDEPTPLALAGAGMLWLLRLAVAPRSTLTGFRFWLLESPVAPGHRQSVTGSAARRPKALTTEPSGGGRRQGTKTARFLALVIEHYGPLAQIDVARVSPISSQLANLAGLNTGAARTALRKAVLDARNGDPR